MLIFSRFSLILSLLLSISLPSQAHHGGTTSINGANLAGPIQTLSAETLAKGKFFLGAGVEYTDVNQISPSKIRSLNRRKETSENLGDRLTPFIAGGYGLTDRISVLFTYPYNLQYDVESTDAGFSLDQGNSIGFGDLTVLGQFKFYENEAKDFKSSLFTGLKFPTGQTRVKDRFGQIHIGDHQPGTGSWDPIFGLAVAKHYKKLSYYASGSYKLSTQGTQEITVGDVINYGVAVAHRVGPHERISRILPRHFFGNDLAWDLVFEINGQWSEKVEEFGAKARDHGGHLLFLTPGVRLVMNDKWVANFNTSMRVQDSLNGFQSRPDLQLGFSLNRVF